MKCGIGARHPGMVIASVLDSRVAELRQFLASSGGVNQWMGEWSAPVWMWSAIRAGYVFSEVWDGVFLRSTLPSEARQQAVLVEWVRSWRAGVERWRVHVPDGRVEASPEQLARWRAGLSDLLACVLRGLYGCLRAGYGLWQWTRAVCRAMRLYGNVKR